MFQPFLLKIYVCFFFEKYLSEKLQPSQKILSLDRETVSEYMQKFFFVYYGHYMLKFQFQNDWFKIFHIFHIISQIIFYIVVLKTFKNFKAEF